MLASYCLLVGLVLGSLASTVARSYFRRGDRPALQPSESVNVFDGTVFPAPHDARWRRLLSANGSGADVFMFGDRDIRLSATTLSVGLAGSGTVVAANNRVTAYYSDVQRCYYAFKQTLALQSVELDVLNAGFGRDEVGASDGTPERREVPQLVERAHAVTGRYAGPLDMSPVFRVDNTHVLPHPTADGWQHGNSDRHPSVCIGGGGHSLTVFKDGDVFLDGGRWFSNKKARELYALVVARLPPKVT